MVRKLTSYRALRRRSSLEPASGTSRGVRAWPCSSRFYRNRRKRSTVSRTRIVGRCTATARVYIDPLRLLRFGDSNRISRGGRRPDAPRAHVLLLREIPFLRTVRRRHKLAAALDGSALGKQPSRRPKPTQPCNWTLESQAQRSPNLCVLTEFLGIS